MPTFETREPISVELDLYVGNVQIIASERTDTVVEIHPATEASDDAEAVEGTAVRYANGKLEINVRWPRNFTGLRSGRDMSAGIRIKLPTGSSVRGSSVLGGFRCEGRFDACDLRTSLGEIWLQHADAARLDTDSGDVTVEHVTSTAELITGMGKVRARQVTGSLVVKNSAGNTTIGSVEGDVRVKTSSGDISIDRAGRSVDARTSAGRIRIGEVSYGSVVLRSGSGGLEVGIREGTAALLDVKSRSGNVRNMLSATGAPETTDQRAEVRARTGFGDIVIHRSTLA